MVTIQFVYTFAEQLFSIMSSKGKDIILNKCVELLLLKGFDAVSISDIQNATGMSRGLIYHHYKNKEELFMEVVGKYLLELFIINLQDVKDFNIEQMINFTHDTYSKICKNNISNASESISIENNELLFYQALIRIMTFESKSRKERADELKAMAGFVSNFKYS